MKFETVAECWESYRTEVMPKVVPEVQSTECRRAFYGGVGSILGLMSNLADLDLTEEQLRDKVNELCDECRRFARAGGK